MFASSEDAVLLSLTVYIPIDKTVFSEMLFLLARY